MHTILLIEDNPANIRIIQRTLENYPYKVVSAQDGESGLMMAMANPPDLILLDLGLPDVDGQTIAAMIKQHDILREIPLVVVTAWPSETAGQMVKAYGCEGYIPKPIDTRRFPGQIAAYLQTDPS
jgi:CheY-like chemotaxis protein